MNERRSDPAMENAASPLEALPERFAHPAVRVMVREVTHLVREIKRGTQPWPHVPPAAQASIHVPGLESIEAALTQQPIGNDTLITQRQWASFARVILEITASAASDAAAPQPATSAPHPAAVIALRLIWGAERFAELPTVMLRPPPAAFLEQLTYLPAPEPRTPPAQLDEAVFLWLQERPPLTNAASDIQGFARVVAACRVVGQLRQELDLEDVAAGYLAWARLLRANPGQLSDISSGWWSSAERQPGKRPGN